MITERSIQDTFFWYNQMRFTTIIPNTYPPGWYECDILAITRASYMYEYEIKLSRSDFFNDRKKGEVPSHLKSFYQRYNENYGDTKHQSLEKGVGHGPSRFWFIVPENLIAVDDIPLFAGLIYCRDLGRIVRFEEVRTAPRLHKTKLSESSKDSIRQNLYHRYWSEREKNNKLQEVREID